jgi:hypothetical protein
VGYLLLVDRSPSDTVRQVERKFLQLKRWAVFARFLNDGRVCLTNNAAERGLRSIALGRKSWLFTGSDREGSARHSCPA